jgi:hypothetical protein
MQSSQGMEYDKMPGDRVTSLKSPLSAQVTFCSSTDSDGYLSRDSSVCTSFSAVASRGHGSHGIPKYDKVRERYFNRLGICASPIEQLDSPKKKRALVASHTSTPSCSVPERNMGHLAAKAKRDTLRLSLSHGDIPASAMTSQEDCSRHDKIILLRRSVQYTTKLKSDPNGDNSSSTAAPSVLLSEFDLSSSWMSLLSTDTASMATSSSYDGAFDLFSLPSDSSIAFGRHDSTKSLDKNNMAQGLIHSRDDLSLSFIPKQRKVSFDSTVKATTIPSRSSYSTRIKSRIWSSSEEIYANGIRNEREFEYDGKNWRTAKEESEFLRCASADELHLVHPVHFCGCPSPSSPLQTERLSESDIDSIAPSRPNEKDEYDEEVHDEPDEMFDMD